MDTDAMPVNRESEKSSPLRWLSTALIVVGLAVIAAGSFLSLSQSILPPLAAGVDSSDLNLDQIVQYVTPSATPPAPTPTGTARAIVTETPGRTPQGVLPATTQADQTVPSPTESLPAAGTTIPSTPSPLPASATPTPTPEPDGPPVRIVAPSIELDAEIVPAGWVRDSQGGISTTSWQVPDFEVGWHIDSMTPGQTGNVVLSGHHNTGAEVFRYLVDLEPDDTIALYTEQHVYTYTVDTKFVLRDKGMPIEKRRENARWIGQFPDERLTMVTCWPYFDNTHRVIVIARPVSAIKTVDDSQ